MPDVADWHADAYSPRWAWPAQRHTCVPENAQLNSLMLPFIPSSSRSFKADTGRHAVQIDHPGLDQTTQLQQVVPVASVARQP